MLAASCLAAVTSNAVATTTTTIREEYGQVQHALARNPGRRPLNWTSAKAAPLIEAAWALVGDRALAHVAAHPDGSAADLVAAVAELNPPEAPADKYDMELEYLEKNPYRLFLHAVRAGDGGHLLYVLSAYYRRWFYKRRSELFVIEGAAPDSLHVTHFAYDGPCGGFGVLPATSSGHVRLLATERYSTMGCEAAGEVRFLEWDGQTMRMLLDRRYNAGGPAWDVRIAGTRVDVKSKGDTKVLFDCGCCEDIQATATFRVGATEVDDLGLEYAVPEIPLIDGFLNRAFGQKDPTPFGTMKAAEELRAIFHDPDSDYLGMFPGMSITREGGDEIVRVNFEKSVSFRIDRRAAPRVTGVRVVASP